MRSIRLLERAIGSTSAKASQQTELEQQLQTLEACTKIRFSSDGSDIKAHKAGVSALTVDPFEGRYLISGGSSATIALWDLEESDNKSPIAETGTSKENHRHGITRLSFFPFDSQAFISSSYDHAVKIYETETLAVSGSFDLESVVYSHAISPIAAHFLVACATQHSVVRLVDLRSGASTHSLAGHRGAVLTVNWNPRNEYVVASGGNDGNIRLWDIRRSASSFATLDMDDSTGCFGDDALGSGARLRTVGQAHVGPCNGVVWTDNGKHLISAGHDEQVRVWDLANGSNTLASFGPMVRNQNLATLLPLLVPQNVSPSGMMLYPNGQEILIFDLFEGHLVKRLRVPFASNGAGRTRITALEWRPLACEFFSCHSDGRIQSWRPKDEAEEFEDVVIEDDERQRKRKALDQVFRNLTKQTVTFL